MLNVKLVLKLHLSQVDLSHVSKDVMLDALNVSLAPVIFSHSSAKGVYNVTRNADDEVLLKLVRSCISHFTL